MFQRAKDFLSVRRETRTAEIEGGQDHDKIARVSGLLKSGNLHEVFKCIHQTSSMIKDRPEAEVVNTERLARFKEKVLASITEYLKENAPKDVRAGDDDFTSFKTNKEFKKATNFAALIWVMDLDARGGLVSVDDIRGYLSTLDQTTKNIIVNAGRTKNKEVDNILNIK